MTERKMSEGEIVSLVHRMIREHKTPTNVGRRTNKTRHKIRRFDVSSYPVTGSTNSVRAIYGGPDNKPSLPSVAYTIDPKEHILTTNVGGNAMPSTDYTVLEKTTAENKPVPPAYRTTGR